VDHAVLQRDRPINVYGHAAAGEQVTVSLADASVRAQADAKGAWSLTLPAMLQHMKIRERHDSFRGYLELDSEIAR